MEVKAVPTYFDQPPSIRHKASENRHDRKLKDFIVKMAQVFNGAVQGVHAAIPEQMKWSFEDWKDLRQFLREPRKSMSDRMNGGRRGDSTPTEDEVEKFRQAVQAFLKVLVIIESDSTCIDYSEISLTFLGILLATEAELLVADGSMQKIAQSAKQRLLAQGELVFTPVVRQIVKFDPLRDDEEAVNLLKSIQPAGYFGENGFVILEDVFNRVNLEDVVSRSSKAFFKMGGRALEEAGLTAIRNSICEIANYKGLERLNCIIRLAQAAENVPNLEKSVREEFGDANKKCLTPDSDSTILKLFGLSLEGLRGGRGLASMLYLLRSQGDILISDSPADDWILDF